MIFPCNIRICGMKCLAFVHERKDASFGRIDATNNWTGADDFSVLPTSSATPTSATQLVMKTYADGILGRTNAWTGSNIFSGAVQLNGGTNFNMTPLNAPTYNAGTSNLVFDGNNYKTFSAGTLSLSPVSATSNVVKAYSFSNLLTGSQHKITVTNNGAGTVAFITSGVTGAKIGFTSNVNLTGTQTAVLSVFYDGTTSFVDVVRYL
jgi:hypothetical protein